jgi:tripartite-type tricarboxylate transporter receptor subunit TctC
MFLTDLKKGKLTLVFFALAFAAAANAAYPDRPIRIVVPFPAAGGTDIIARTILNPLSQALGGSMFIDNKPGANGEVGTAFVGKSVPDGYTLLLGGIGALTISPHMEKMPYDAEKDFIPITNLVKADLFLLANPKFAPRTVADLIKYSKEMPGKVNFASSGAMGPNHLLGEMFNSDAGIKMMHVPYRGEAPAFTDLLGGHVEVAILSVAGGGKYVDSGELRAIAVFGEKRLQQYPDIPTISETVAGFVGFSWQGIFAPAGTPPEIVQKIAKAVATILQDKALRETIAKQGNLPVGNSPEDFAKFVNEERAKWKKAVTAAGLAKR